MRELQVYSQYLWRRSLTWVEFWSRRYLISSIQQGEKLILYTGAWIEDFMRPEKHWLRMKFCFWNFSLVFLEGVFEYFKISIFPLDLRIKNLISLKTIVYQLKFPPWPLTQRLLQLQSLQKTGIFSQLESFINSTHKIFHMAVNKKSKQNVCSSCKWQSTKNRVINQRLKILFWFLNLTYEMILP